MDAPGFRELRAADRGRVQAIFDECFGAGFRVAPSPGNGNRLTLVATDNDAPVGIGIARLMDIDHLPHELGERLWAATHEWPVWREHVRVALLEGAAVARAHRGRGIHSQLVAMRLAWALSAGATAAVSLTWRPERDDYAACTLSRAGFIALAHVPDYWSADARERGYHCPECEEGCRCTMTLHVYCAEPAA